MNYIFLDQVINLIKSAKTEKELGNLTEEQQSILIKKSIEIVENRSKKSKNKSKCKYKKEVSKKFDKLNKMKEY